MTINGFPVSASRFQLDGSRLPDARSAPLRLRTRERATRRALSDRTSHIPHHTSRWPAVRQRARLWSSVSQAAAALALALWAVALSGCARGGPGGPALPRRLLDVSITFAAPVNDSCFYFFAIDADDDPSGADGPIPVVSGPFIANGWGTGSMTHFLEYNLGQYRIFQTQMRLSVTPGGGIVGATGQPTNNNVGTYVLTVNSVTLGAATLTTVTAPGALTAVNNVSDQNAGTFSIATDAAGQTIAGQVTFAPAANGGKPPTGAAAAQLAALNAGGVPLAANSLDQFGLSLTISGAVDKSGVQQITVGPATGSITSRFTDQVTGQVTTITGTVTANSSTPTASPPIPGVGLVTEDLVASGVAQVLATLSDVAVFLDYPFDFTNPAGGNTLQATIQTALLGPPSLRDISFNIIATDQLLLVPNAPHRFDGLGLGGNDYVTIDISQDRVYRNSDSLNPEGPGDPSTGGVRAIDIVDWQVGVRFLR